MADFGDAMADADDGGLAAGVEIAATGLVDDPAASAMSGDRIGFAKTSGEEGGIGWHDDAEIVAEGKLAWMPRMDEVPGRGAAVLPPARERDTLASFLE